MNTFKKLSLGLFAILAASIPLFFTTSCVESVPNANKPKNYRPGLFGDIFSWKYRPSGQFLTIHNQYYPDYETGELIEDCGRIISSSYEYNSYIDPSMYHTGIRIVSEKYDEWGGKQFFCDKLIFDPYLFNMWTPHPEFTFRVIAKEYDSNEYTSAQTITVPAYDGIGKSIGNWDSEYGQSQGYKDKVFPWLSLWDSENSWFEVFGPWNMRALKTGVHFERIDAQKLCSTRIISLPNGVVKIHENAFNLEQELYVPVYPDSIRTVASQAFRQWVYGSENKPEDGLWCELQFEGGVVKKENIGQGAFYHCWSLEKSLASYYGSDVAYSMVHNGTH